MKPKLLLLDKPCEKVMELLDAEYWNYYGNFSALKYPANQYTGVYTQLTKFDLIDKFPNLKFIATPCTGTDHIDVKYCNEHNIDIIHLDEQWKQNEGRDITSTAEHTWSLILQLAKMSRMQLKGKTLGVIGYGRIGQQVAKYAEAFDMRTLLCNERTAMFKDAVIRTSNIITLHVPLNDETRGMIGKEQFDMMKPGTLLVNTSRAEIVDGCSLMGALDNKKIGGYADDFYGLDNGGIIFPTNNPPVIQTPHIGGNCIEAREATDIYISTKIKEYIKSGNK